MSFLYQIGEKSLKIDKLSFLENLKKDNISIYGYSNKGNNIKLYIDSKINIIKLKKYFLDNIPLVKTLKNESNLKNMKIVKILFLVDVKFY